MAPDAPFAELKMHNDWHCPCGGSGEHALWRDARCGACGGARLGSLRTAAAQAAEHSRSAASKPAAPPPPLAAPPPPAAAPPPPLAAPPPPPAALPCAPTRAPAVAVGPPAAPPAVKLTSAWDLALGGSARASVVLRCPLIYEKLDSCLQVVAENNSHGSGGGAGGGGSGCGGSSGGGGGRSGAAGAGAGANRLVPVCKGGSWRAWAFDLPSYGAGGGAPKRYIAATVRDFGIAYGRLRADARHAYEIIDAGRP